HSAVIGAQEKIAVSLAFSHDDARRCIVEGGFSAEVTLACQRCLNPYAETLRGDFRFAVVWDEDRASVLPKQLDPWLVSGEVADLYELVEDEILLSLPTVAFH